MSFVQFCDDLDKNKKDLLNAIEVSKKNLDILLKSKNKTYNSFIMPYNKDMEKIELLFAMIGHIDSVNNSEQSKKIYSEVLPIVDDYLIDLSNNKKLYDSYVYILENDDNLDDIKRKTLIYNIDNFKLSGINLSQEKQDELKKIQLRLSVLSKDFSQNIIDANNKYELLIENYEDVKELPQADINASKIAKDNKTYYKFTLQMPSYIAYMTYGSNSKYREELYKAYVSRASENEDLIDEILSLREQKAKILGFDSYSDYSIFKKDAKDVEYVENFLIQVANKAKPLAKKELQELERFAKEEINSTNVGYFSQKLKEHTYDFDEEMCMEYFSKDIVVKFAMEFLEKSFDVKIVLNTKVNVWHKSVVVYDFYENDEIFGRLYLDLENRASKKGGAWMHNFQAHYIDENNNKNLASAFVVCNFMQSTSSQISLLKHSDIVTFFHEMGHAIHHIFSKVTQSDLSGVNGVKWDVVECPSQFLEQFAYSESVLKSIGKHYKTNESISDELIQKIIKAKNFQASMGIIRQCEFAIFDILLHKQLYKKQEVQKLLDSVREKYSVLMPPSYNKFQNSFSHIFAGGYASGYYSYKYSEVLSANLYKENEKKSILKKYKENILYKGSSKNMTLMTKSIIGKEPQIDALFSLYGIKE